jgi:hypothetical protein
VEELDARRRLVALKVRLEEKRLFGTSNVFQILVSDNGKSVTVAFEKALLRSEHVEELLHLTGHGRDVFNNTDTINCNVLHPTSKADIIFSILKSIF